MRREQFSKISLALGHISKTLKNKTESLLLLISHQTKLISDLQYFLKMLFGGRYHPNLRIKRKKVIKFFVLDKEEPKPAVLIGRMMLVNIS